MELNGATAIIAGSTGHFGKAIALALAKAGCDCLCHYHRDKEAAANIVKAVTDTGGRALAVRADITKESEVAELFDAAESFSSCQILINCAGVFKRQPLEQIRADAVRKIFDINVTAAMLLTASFADHIKKNADKGQQLAGKIIHFADVGGIMGWGQCAPYCASKAALIGLVKSAAKELAPLVAVNAIAPGMINWPSEFDEQEKKRQRQMIPMRREGEIADIVNAVMFLLDNDYITGQVLRVDGGRCI
jgi:NAD(P)-dependent dehydrogenase (short-subunit alcohol dehydrogenase family)